MLYVYLISLTLIRYNNYINYSEKYWPARITECRLTEPCYDKHSLGVSYIDYSREESELTHVVLPRFVKQM